MKNATKLMLLAALCLSVCFTSCVSKKKYNVLQTDLERANEELGSIGPKLSQATKDLAQCESDLRTLQQTSQLREEQVQDLRNQINDYKQQRNQQLTQVDNLTVLSKSANENINKTLEQLEKKDEYIQLLQAAKTKTDSINLALAVNLKSVLQDGLTDEDVEVKVDKTVVFVNLSDKMLYNSGSATITPRAKEVLGKIAQIIESRPELEVMVEGYTDNVPIKNSCMADNWDLSVKRATSVVRVLQQDYNVDPNRLIAAGRGEYNTLASNDTASGRSTNRRTRIIILPKIGEFYDLLNPNNVPE